MRVSKWLRKVIGEKESRRVRMRQAASRDRQRIILRPWSFELLEDRSLLAGLSGLHNIGPTGDFTSITAAIASIQTNGLDGAVTLELQPSYVSAVETFPLVFSNLGTTSTNTITLRPEIDATNLMISSADTSAATVDLNGARFLTIDGRPGGMGSHFGSGGGAASMLTIENTSTSGVALRFINEASSNNVIYTTLRGVNTSVTSGVVLLSDTTGLNGNDNNKIDHCDIRDGASTPFNGVFSRGNTSTVSQFNSGNVISNSNIFNFFNASGSGVGIQFDDGNTDSTIESNSFFQTAIRTTGLWNSVSIFIQSPSGNNFRVSGNFIGGSEPNAGGTYWTKVGSQSRFVGIWLNVGTTEPSNIQGNTIRNFRWSSSGLTVLPGAWSGIYVQSGSSNVGTEIGNVIGSSDTNYSVWVTYFGNGITVYGIGSTSNGTVNIANNTIGSISAQGSIIGINVTAGVNNISDNTVGSKITPNSLHATEQNPFTTREVTGILSTSTSISSITRNVVANLRNDSENLYATIRGIVTSAGVNNIVGNVVRQLTTMSTNINVTTSPSVAGILQSSTAIGQTLSENIVFSLVNSKLSSNVVRVIGILYSGPTSGTNVIERNFVHSLDIPDDFFSSNGSSVVGMYFGAGTFTAKNNMVRVGVMEGGNTTTRRTITIGIIDRESTDGRHYYHNSVYIGGTHSGGFSGSTSAFVSFGLTNVRDFQNNIFVNARSNGTGTIKHYAISWAGSGPNPSGLTSNSNIFFASGVGGFLGRYSGVDVSTITEWQLVTGQDANSLNTDPLFVNAIGNAGNVNLHLQNGSPAINAGVPIAGFTTDFDGELRSTTQPDIGADETDELVPTVAGIFASGSAWSAAFIDAVDGDGIGAGNGLGYRLTPGLTLPNAGIDRIYLQFSEPVIGFDASTVAILGVNVADYATVSGLMSVSYDSVNRRGIIQLASGLTKDKLRIGVSDTVKDLSMNALDGDANASPGGVFDLRFNVLVGDANSDGNVNGGDLPAFALAFNKSIGSVSYNSLADWNSDGSVNGGDLPLFAARFNQSLPTAEPAALDFPPALLPPLDSESMLAPPIEEIEEVFSQLDDDDELLEV